MGEYSSIKQRASVGQQVFDHPDYTDPLTLAEVLSDLLDRVVRQESAYVSIDAEIRYEEQVCCTDSSCFMCK